MLLEIERDGMDAVRRYSQQLDGWGPERFAMTPRRARRARATPSTPASASVFSSATSA